MIIATDLRLRCNIRAGGARAAVDLRFVLMRHIVLVGMAIEKATLSIEGRVFLEPLFSYSSCNLCVPQYVTSVLRSF